MLKYLIAFAAGLGGLLFGYEIGVVSQVLSLDTFAEQFGYRVSVEGVVQKCTASSFPTGCYETEEETTGWVTFTFLIGAALGSPFVAFFSDRLGRKWSIVAASVIFVAGGVGQSLSNHVAELYVSRVLSGIAIAGMHVVVPTYISECSSAKERGRNVGSYIIFICFGIFISSVVNLAIIKGLGFEDPMNWRLCLGMQAVPGAIMFLLMLFMPYSPRWLANKDRSEESLATLARISRKPSSDSEVQQEFEQIQASIRQERSLGNPSWFDLLKPGMLNRVIIASLLLFFEQFSGVNAISFYQTSLYASLGFSDDLSQILTVVMSFVEVIGSLPGLMVIDTKFGRRNLFLVGSAVMSISFAMITLFCKISTDIMASYAWGAIAFIIVFFIAFNSTWGTAVWVYSAEIFPLRLRSKGVSIAIMTHWVGAAIVAKMQPIMFAQIDVYSFLVYASISAIAFVFTYFTVYETQGKSLEEIDELFMPKHEDGAQIKGL